MLCRARLSSLDNVPYTNYNDYGTDYKKTRSNQDRLSCQRGPSRALLFIGEPMGQGAWALTVTRCMKFIR